MPARLLHDARETEADGEAAQAYPVPRSPSQQQPWDIAFDLVKGDFQVLVLTPSLAFFCRAIRLLSSTVLCVQKCILCSSCPAK